MDALTPARLQFATTAAIHWTFVLISLGMLVALVILQTRALLTRTPDTRALLYRMTRYWGQLYVINYAVGIASGIVMEFQFGANWSGLSHLVGDVFGAPLAVETLVAFAAESTFLALWIFGWEKLHEWVHAGLLWLVMISAYASAFWVLVANGFMQDPRGYTLADNGRARLTDAAALLNNPSTWQAFWHIAGAGLAVAGVVITFISSVWLFRRAADRDFFVRSFRMGFLLGFAGILLAMTSGWSQYVVVAQHQPAKALSAMMGESAEVQAALTEQFGPGEYVHSGLFEVFSVMMLIGQLGVFMMFILTPIAMGKLPAKASWLMPLFWLALPLPFIAAVCGWVFREMGRQPWAIYGVQRTAEAVSDVNATTMWTSYVVFTVVLVGLLFTSWWLIARHAVRGPQREIFGVSSAPRDVSARPLEPSGV